MSLLSLAWMAFAWMLGGFVHGVTSIGCSMVAMPLISFTVEPREAIVIACLAGGIVPLMLFAVYHRHLLRRETLWLSLGCLPGIPAGTAMLASLPAAMAGVLISIPVVRHMPQELFRKLLLLMVLVSGITLLGRAVM